MKRVFLLPVFLPLIFFSFFQKRQNLCKENETVVISFQLHNSSKTVSLCKEKNGKYLVYRFGTVTKIELEYPELLDSSSWKKFSLNGAKRFGGKANAGFGDYRISFYNKNTKYELFDSWSDEDRSKDIGVRVIVNDNTKTLKGNYTSKDGSLLRLDDEQTRIPNREYNE